MTWLEEIITCKTLKLKTQKDKKGIQVFDIIRKKWIYLSEEEKVRQLFIHYLKEIRNIPLSKISIEKKFTLQGLNKRFDLIILNEDFGVDILCEFKKETEPIYSNKHLDQLLNYQIFQQARVLLITNGTHTFGYKKAEHNKIIEITSLNECWD